MIPLPNYEQLSEETEARIREDRRRTDRSPYAAREDLALRRNPADDQPSAWRRAYVRDVDKIMHSPFYNRYTDKTQVFSFYKNDDISRRALHVQLVSRIARTIGAALGLNCDLIEAIALGHDIGHTPFGHAGERYISEILHANTGRYFNHNVHSVRVLDGIFEHNLTLDTLSGILAHNGEFEAERYLPSPVNSFSDFDATVESCYVDEKNILKIVPSTMEGCVVRVADIIAYLGRDRLDAARAKLFDGAEHLYADSRTINAEIINNLEVNIIEQSYGKPYIAMDRAHYESMRAAKQENYALIYRVDRVMKVLDETVRPMIGKLYERLLSDLVRGDKSSPVFRHHIDFVTHNHYAKKTDYLETEKNQIVVDYLASMTDDYCIELYGYLFPKEELKIHYHGYFEDLM